jgi:hypothetical protein
MVMMRTTLLPYLYVLALFFVCGRPTTGFQPAKRSHHHHHHHHHQLSQRSNLQVRQERQHGPTWTTSQASSSSSSSVLHLKAPKSKATDDDDDDEKINQEWDLGLLLVYMTPWKNPNSIFVYMFAVVYGLGKYSESMMAAQAAANL